jgi:acyl carrier protein
MEEKRIIAMIISSLQELKEVFAEGNISPIDSNTRIFGRGGLLDSMGLVSLITDLEEKIEDEFRISLILANERAMSQRRSPFRTVSSLVENICMLMKEHEAK